MPRAVMAGTSLPATVVLPAPLQPASPIMRMAFRDLNGERQQPPPDHPQIARPECLSGRVVLRLEREVPHASRRIGDLADAGPRLLVVRDDELVDARRDHVPLDA